LINQRVLRTANFLVTRSATPWAWGEWDCNLFITDYLDHLDSGTRSEYIRHKYTDLRSAIRFQKTIPSAPEWIALQGYGIITSSELQDYDIVLEPESGYWHAGLVFGGSIWSVEIDRGTVIRPIEATEYTLGRQHG
jgi:hypothetical protein